MASCGNQQFCTLCLEDDISNEAVTWCIDCETFLCSTCEKHHKRNKSSKDHRTIALDEYEKLPAFILNTSNRCVEHDKRYELYCRFHDSACCVQCINDKHKGCRDLPLLTDVLGNIKSSAAMFQIEKDIMDIKESFDKIEKIVSNKTETLENQKEKGVVAIQRMRKLINDHLDKLENQLLEKLLDEYSKLKSITEELMCKLEERRKHIDLLREDFVKMKNFATDLQTFVGSKIIEDLRKAESKYIEGLQSSGELNTKYLQVSMSSAVNSIVNDVKSFGDISVRSAANSLELKSGTDIREQMPVTKVRDITYIKPKLKKMIKMPKQDKQHEKMEITGCQILPDGQLLFVNRNKKCLMLFSEDGEYTRDVVTFGSQPWNVCCIGDNTVAVTLYDAKMVKIVDVKNNKITKSFGTKDSCYGIDFNQRSMILTTGKPRPDVLSLDINNETISKVVSLYATVRCVTCFENKIYLAHLFEDSVLCYQQNGDLLWTYKHDNIKSPRSLSVDRDGFVYVSCDEIHKIVVLTPDGKQGKVILTQNDGLRDPVTLNIDKRTSTRLVGNFDDGNAFLFKI